MSKNFYKDKRWISKREKILRRDEYLCQECKRYGKSSPATTVHHIIPLAWCLIYLVLFGLDSINLISLCSKCHDKMHDRVSNKLTTLGLSWVERIGQQGLEWVKKYGGEW